MDSLTILPDTCFFLKFRTHILYPFYLLNAVLLYTKTFVFYLKNNLSKFTINEYT